MKVMERGQITIPKKYREQYGIYQDTEIDFIPKENGLLIKKKSSGNKKFRDVFGILKKKNVHTNEYIKEIRGR
jgi:AbrB family looped-hinge helix DNA binding protein